MASEAIQKVAESVGHSSAATKGGATIAASSGFVAFFSENYQAIAAFSAVGGFVIALIGLGFNIYFQIKRNELIKRAGTSLNPNQET